MINKNKLFLIFFIVLLSFSLLTGCQSNNSSDVENAQETVGAESNSSKNNEEPYTEQNKMENEDIQQEYTKEEPNDSSKEIIPASSSEEPKTPENQKPSQEPANEPKEESVKKPDDKTSLHIEGSAVDKPIVLTLDELKAMKEAYYEDDYFSLNSFGTKEYFHFKGVKIKAILDMVSIKDEASIITFVASDGYKHEMTLEDALKEDYIDEQNPEKKYPVIIAWNENGNDYDPNKGNPFRLVIGQKEPDDVNKPQWVQNLAKIVIE